MEMANTFSFNTPSVVAGTSPSGFPSPASCCCNWSSTVPSPTQLTTVRGKDLSIAKLGQNMTHHLGFPPPRLSLPQQTVYHHHLPGHSPPEPHLLNRTFFYTMPLDRMYTCKSVSQGGGIVVLNLLLPLAGIYGFGLLLIPNHHGICPLSLQLTALAPCQVVWGAKKNNSNHLGSEGGIQATSFNCSTGNP